MVAKERALEDKKAAEGLIKFMQYDLRDKLGKLGRLDIMDAINSTIIKYFDTHLPTPGDLDASKERAIAEQQQGDILFDRGNLSEALKQYRAAENDSMSLLKQKPESTEYKRYLSSS
jgi:hypothetical protein